MPPPEMANLSGVISAALGAAEGGRLPEGTDKEAVEAASADLLSHLEAVLEQVASASPRKGCRGMRGCVVRTLAGPVRVSRRYRPGAGRDASPGFAGCKGRVTSGAVRLTARRSAFCGSLDEAAEASRALAISRSLVRRIALDVGKELHAAPVTRSPSMDAFVATPGRTRRVPKTLVMSVDGTCVPCTRADTRGISGRDGREAKGRELKVSMAGVYDRVRVEDSSPVLPRQHRQYRVTDGDAEAARAQVGGLGKAAAGRDIARTQTIGDGADWVEGIMKDLFPHAEFTVDIIHAASYLNTICQALAPEDTAALFRKARGIMRRYSAETALRFLRKKYPDTMAAPQGDAAAAVKYIEKRLAYMQYGRLRREGYFISSCHIESAGKAIVGVRCKQAGMHWRHENSAYIASIRAAVKSGAY